VDLVQIFDSWAGVLSRPLYQTFVIPYLKRICDNITKVPVTLFSKGAWFSISDLAVLNCATIGLDWQMDPAWARAEAGESKTLQGNLDPAVLYGSTGEIISKTKEMLSLFGPYRHIANLGHGVYPDIDPSKLKCFITTVQEFQHQPS
ncbi:MAG: uroporphyrinogen decarboxylase, partial [Crocinitomicaceae bacterium]|nr:uroporphyrinogen decarboxylase [Crocinitomicaceae bacterium]